MTVTCDDYRMTNKQASSIKGLTLLPKDIRRLGLKKYAQDHGTEAIIDLFAEFIGIQCTAIRSPYIPLMMQDFANQFTTSSITAPACTKNNSLKRDSRTFNQPCTPLDLHCVNVAAVCGFQKNR